MMLWSNIKADVKQRTRQNSFTVALVLMAVLTLLFFPSPQAQYQTLIINDYRGIYNSAWLGVCLAMLNVLFLPLLCFFLIKNAINTDRRQHIGELIAASSLSKPAYILAKWFGNLVILLTIVVVMILTSIVIQLFYGESYLIDIWALVWPQMVYVLPLLFAIASIAILFESIRRLSGSIGNIVYFMVWVGSIVQTIESVSGIGQLLNEIETEITTRFPNQEGVTNVGVALTKDESSIKTFVWHGIEPTITHVLGMLPMLAFSGLCLLIAIFAFDRFSQNQPQNVNQKPISRWSIMSKIARLFDSLFKAVTQHFKFTQLLRLELKLLLNDRSAYWLIGLIVLNAAQLLVTSELQIKLILPLSWLWCLLIISQLGVKEKQHGVSELIGYSRHLGHQYELASYFAAWIILLVASLASVVTFIIEHDGLLLIQLMIAISFTSALAMFCGTVSSSKRLFEGLYLFLWYVGPTQAALYLDFFGVNSQASWQAGMPYMFLAITLALLAFSIGFKRITAR